MKWLLLVFPPSPAPRAVINSLLGSEISGYGSSFCKHSQVAISLSKFTKFGRVANLLLPLALGSGAIRAQAIDSEVRGRKIGITIPETTSLICAPSCRV